MTSDDDLIVTDRMTKLLSELDKQAEIRLRSLREHHCAARRCREIVVELLREKIVRRKDLIGRPFSSSALAIITNEAGLTRHYRPRAATTTTT